ncbi:hypothetical protein LINPERPRIM_LOCUS31716, partial [Linum perenne]
APSGSIILIPFTQFHLINSTSQFHSTIPQFHSPSGD